MADDDIDLDAMLDSALDEEFAATSPTGADAGGEGGGGSDLDLDAMLDEAIVSASPAADQGQQGDESKRSGDKLP